jgi:hypothetical protein
MLAFLFFGAQASADDQRPITDLQRVFDHPVASNGRMFEGHVYLYVGGTAYYFFPRKVTDTEFQASDIDVLPGQKSEALDLAKYKSGERLLLHARINVDTACFEPGMMCVPFRHLISLDDPIVIQR